MSSFDDRQVRERGLGWVDSNERDTGIPSSLCIL